MKTQELMLSPWEGVDENDLVIPMWQEAHNEITILIVDKNGNHYFELSAEKMSITNRDEIANNFGLFIRTFKYYPQLLHTAIYEQAFHNFINFARSGMCITNDGNYAYYQYLWVKFGPVEKPIITTILGLHPTNINQNEADIIYMKEFVR